jgi:DNA-binding beta-propeller fold protein YncE
MKSTAVLILTVLGVFSGRPLSSGYHVANEIALPGAGGWDLLVVDDTARRVYISHATQVDVLDADTGKAVGTIGNTPGVHGIALAPELGRGFITAGKADCVVIFDLKTLKAIARVSTGKKPDAVVFDPATNRVFAMNGDGNSATVIKAADGAIDGTIELGGGPEFSVADGKGNLWVNLEDKSELLHIDSRSMKIADRWDVAPCQEPSSMALDSLNRRLFLGCRNRVMAVVDADSGKVVASYPIGDHVDASAFDPAAKLVFHSTGDGNVAIFREDNPNTYTFLGNVATIVGSKTMALDTKTHRLFVPALRAGDFFVLILDPGVVPGS